jgi:hypothetical protein
MGVPQIQPEELEANVILVVPQLSIVQKGISELALDL